MPASSKPALRYIDPSRKRRHDLVRVVANNPRPFLPPGVFIDD